MQKENKIIIEDIIKIAKTIRDELSKEESCPYFKRTIKTRFRPKIRLCQEKLNYVKRR